MKIPESLGFTMFVDEDRADLFCLFVNLYLEFEEHEGKNDMQPMAVTARETFQRFIKELMVPVHKNGWCKDPDCKYESGPEFTS